MLKDAASSAISRGALDRGPRGQIAGGERPGGCADTSERGRDGAGEHERSEDGRGSRPGRDGENLHVGAHVEHDPAREQDGGERHADRDERKPDELQRDRRRPAQEEGEDEPRGEAAGGDDEGERDHGSSR